MVGCRHGTGNTDYISPRQINYRNEQYLSFIIISNSIGKTNFLPLAQSESHVFSSLHVNSRSRHTHLTLFLPYFVYTSLCI